MSTIVNDGTLEPEEALGALRLAAQRATEALPTALSKCENEDQRQAVVADRDAVVLAYLACLKKTLVHTGPLFENMAIALQKEAEDIGQKVKDAVAAADACNLFTDLVKLAATLALAFG